MLWTFIPIAAVLTLTPGPATALVVRSSLRGGLRAALATTAGNSLGVLAWGLLSVLGISALVAASEAAYLGLKAVGAVVLVVLGVQSLLRARRGEVADGATVGERDVPESRGAFRAGLVTGFANPKLAVFFVALFPQFVPAGEPVLPAALLMTAMVVAFDVLWFSVLATAVTRLKRRVVESGMAAWFERVTGTVLIALGLGLALERR